ISKGAKSYTPNVFTSVYHPGKRSYELLTELNYNAKAGNVVSVAELNLLKLLGIENHPRVKESEKKALELISAGSAAAHTVLGFLIRHNLSTSDSLKQTAEREIMLPYSLSDARSLSRLSDIDHLVEAAEGGDPLAQLIVAEHHRSRHRCVDAVNMYRRSAVQALSSIEESRVSMATYGPFVEPSDGPDIHWPTEEEIQFFEYQAINGDVDAAVQVAAVYLSAELGLHYDIDKAVRYLKIAIEGEIPVAMIFMAHLHLEGKVANPDLVYAKELLEKALDLGDPTAHAAYARFYLEGLAGVQRNVDLAIEHYQKGIEFGHLDSMFGMGQLLATLPSDDREHQAVEYWSVPAANGHVHASWYTAEYFTKLSQPSARVIGGSKTELSSMLCELSLPHYRSVALAGEWSDLIFAAYEDFKMGRFDASAIKYMLLSDMGYSVAHVNLGRLLQTGKVSLYPKEQLPFQEFQTWERAANSSIPLGYLQLGNHYYYGTENFKPGNKSQAAHFYYKAMSSNPEAAFNLAYLYEWGEGVSQDVTKAMNLYTITANSSSDAWLPATLALSRLHFFWFVNSSIGFNFYSVSYSTYKDYIYYYGENVNALYIVLNSI
ncbi:Sel1-like repeat, partial [Trinorchestia longiramus]